MANFRLTSAWNFVIVPLERECTAMDEESFSIGDLVTWIEENIPPTIARNLELNKKHYGGGPFRVADVNPEFMCSETSGVAVLQIEFPKERTGRTYIGGNMFRKVVPKAK